VVLTAKCLRQKNHFARQADVHALRLEYNANSQMMLLYNNIGQKEIVWSANILDKSKKFLLFLTFWSIHSLPILRHEPNADSLPFLVSGPANI
jgi:hypothetical protein